MDEKLDGDAGALALPSGEIAHRHVAVPDQIEVAQDPFDCGLDVYGRGRAGNPEAGGVVKRPAKREIQMDDVSGGTNPMRSRRSGS